MSSTILVISLFIWFYGLILYILKVTCKNSTIAIDFDNLVDISSIITRGNIYIENVDNVTLEDYIYAHISEQEVIPRGILKALKYQGYGYKLIFYSSRPEYLRKETAQILNDWDLRGELFMNTDNQPSFFFKVNILSLIKETRRYLVGIIETDELVRNYAKDVFKVKSL